MPAGGTGGGSAGGTAGGSAGGSGGSGGGSGGGSSGAMSCATATAALCDRAAACGAGANIVVSIPTATAEHQSLADCKNYYLFLVCPSADGDAGTRDWAACQSAVGASACAASSKGESAPLPQACPGLTL